MKQGELGPCKLGQPARCQRAVHVQQGHELRVARTEFQLFRDLMAEEDRHRDHAAGRLDDRRFPGISRGHKYLAFASISAARDNRQYEGFSHGGGPAWRKHRQRW